MSIDDVIDFTPALRAEALDIINSRVRFGPIRQWPMILPEFGLPAMREIRQFVPGMLAETFTAS